jgi:hypothetical protein
MKRRFMLMVPVLITLFGFFQTSMTKAEAQSTVVELNLEQLGYGNVRLEGLNGTASIWVPTQSDWLIKETPITMTLTYIASPLLIAEKSTLTVYANDFPVTSIRPISDGAQHTVSFSIPSTRFGTTDYGFLLGMTGELVIDDGLCRDVSNPGQWLEIQGTSSLQFWPVLDLAPPTLDDLPTAVIVQNPTVTNPPPTVFVLPDNPTAVELSTAAKVAARLTRSAASSGNRLTPFEVETYSSIKEAQQSQGNFVVIGEPSRQHLVEQLQDILATQMSGDKFLTTDNVEMPAEHGVVQIISSPWNPARHILLVSGGSPEGLELAGNAFEHTPTFNAFDGQFKFISGLEPEQDSDGTNIWESPTVSFAELGFGDARIVGMGTFSQSYDFRVPPGWQFGSGSELELNIATSPALDSTESHIAVYLNEIPVGVVVARTEGAEQTVRFPLPVDVINETPMGTHPQAISLRLDVSNYMNIEICEIVFYEAAWTQINSNSTLIIPESSYLPYPDIHLLPYPFVSDNDASPTTIIVPEDPTTNEIDQLLAVAATLGRFSPGDFELNVTTSAEASPASLSDSHLIVLGTLDRNPLIEEFNASLGEINDPGVYEALANPEFGILREDLSPWNNELAVLLFYSQSENGLDDVVSAFYDSAPPLMASATVAVSNGNATLRTLESIAMESEGAVAEGSGAAAVETPSAVSGTPSGDEAAMTEEAQAFATFPPTEENVPPTAQSVQSPFTLYLILGLAILAIPLAFWLSRQNR